MSPRLLNLRLRFLGQLAPALTLALALPAVVSAQTTFIKADNTTSFSQASGYTNVAGLPTADDFIELNSTITAARSVSLGGNVSARKLTVTNPAGTFTISTSTSSLTLGDGGIDLANATANLTINAGVAASADHTWQVGTGRTFQMGNGSFLNANGFAIGTAGAGTLDWRSNTAGTLTGAITNTSLSINSASASLTLTNAANTYSSLAIPAGKLTVTNVGALGTDTNISLGNTTNGIIDYAGTTASTAQIFTRDGRSAASGLNVTTAGETLTISGAMASNSQINAGSSGWVFGGAGNLVLTGAMGNATGVGSTGTTVTKNGSGTLSLAGTNTATGAITVNEGTLSIGQGGTTGSVSDSATITNSSSLLFNRSDAALIHGGVIAGSGTVTKLGAGQVEFTGANTYSGKTTIAQGTLAISHAGAIGTATSVDLGADGTTSGTLKYTGANAATVSQNVAVLGGGQDAVENAGSGALTLSGGATINGKTLTLRGGASGITVTGALTGSSVTSQLVIDSGTVLLSSTGLNTYAGTTSVLSGGTLTAGAAGSLSASSDILLSGGTLSVGISANAGGGGGFANAAGSLTLTSNSVIEFSSGGTLAFASSALTQWAPNAVLTLAGDFTSGTSLRFGTDATGLSSLQLGQFALSSGLASFSLDSSGYLVTAAAVPEPSTYALMALGGALCVYFHRRRRTA